MKNARELGFADIESAHDAIAYVLRVRFAECLSRQPALFSGDDEAIHGFRLACKRLRYAIERWDEELPQLQSIAKFLSHMTDDLGVAHDCTVLAERSHDAETPLVARHALRDRDRYVRHARRVWRRAFRRGGGFEPLADYTGFNWELPE